MQSYPSIPWAGHSNTRLPYGSDTELVHRISMINSTLATLLYSTSTTLFSDSSGTTLATLFNTTIDPNASTTALPATEELPPGPRFNIFGIVLLSIIAGLLSILTVAGNVMVMISFKIDKQLQTISNYFLFSLAIADFAIGLISMPLFTVTTILGYWPLGPYICDTWLALDYLASNASVLNLLIISFDRYFSVTRPLTYRAKRTTTRAAIMIAAAWGISLLLWPPWIYSWPYIEGKRTVPQYECYIQFIETNHYITFGTAIAAFYVPVTVMCFLYYRIWRETKKRQKDLPNLQAGKKDSSKRSNSSDENTAVNHHAGVMSVSQLASAVGGDGEGGWRRPRSESSADAESVYMTNAVLSDSGYAHASRRSSMDEGAMSGKPTTCAGGVKEWCVAWWHSGREDSDDYGYEAEDPSDLGYATPVSIETPLQSSVSRCTSLNVIRDPYAPGRPGIVSIIPDVSPTPNRSGGHLGPNITNNSNTLTTNNSNNNNISTVNSNNSSNNNGHTGITNSSSIAQVGQEKAGGGGLQAGSRDSRSLPGANRMGNRSVSQDSVYTILIRLPSDGGAQNGQTGEDRAPSIKMIQDDVPLPLPHPSRRALPSRDSEYSLPITRRSSQQAQDIRIPLNAKIISKPIVKPLPAPRQIKKKKKSQEKKQETKAAKTLSAILLSFIITWTPYNILVLLKPLTGCTKCFPQELWDFFYALCYINSTINPVCYALCNASFRRTYVRILTCKWHTRNREAMTRGVYN